MSEGAGPEEALSWPRNGRIECLIRPGLSSVPAMVKHDASRCNGTFGFDIMNLWLRLILTALTALFRRKVGLFDTTVLRLRVLPNDLDFNGHANNGRYLTLADLGRLDYVIRCGSAAVAIKLKAAPIVGDATAKFRKDLHLFQRFEIHTRLLGWDEKWTFMEHRFVSRGRVVGVVTIRGLFLSKQGPVAPSVFLHAFGLQTASPALPPSVSAWSKSCELLSDSLRQHEDQATGARHAAA